MRNVFSRKILVCFHPWKINSNEQIHFKVSPCMHFKSNQTWHKETLFSDQIPWAEIYVLVSQLFRSRWQCSEYLRGAVKMTRKEKLIKHGKSKSAIHNWNAFHLSIMCCALSASGNCYRKNVAVWRENHKLSRFFLSFIKILQSI